MRRRGRHWLIIGSAAIAALLLTITNPSPKGLISIGVGNRAVRAAPGQALSSLKIPHNLAALEIVNKTLIRIQEAYVDPSRIDPKEMLFSALDSVQFNISEVLVKPDRSNDSITVFVNDKHQTFSTRDVDSSWRLSKTLKRIFRFIEANMNSGADLAKVEYAAANGILETLDPHSLLLDPEAAADFRTSTGGGFAGLGIVIGMRKKKLTVIRPMPGTPAFKAGIKARDLIVRIDDELTENLTLTESVNRMRGETGTEVILVVERAGAAKKLSFPIFRARITVTSVQSKLLDKKVGYLRIKQFSSPTTRETKAALHSLIDQGATSFVLDLRSNPGGLLNQAIRITDLFVDRGTIVTTVGGNEREAHQASRDKTLSRAPLAVLLNSNSASASEIVAGALKNLDRAIIIGDTSFGKGSVQLLYDNDDLSTLKLTIAEYLTPGDLSIQGLGISPDVKLQRMFVPTKNTGPKDHLRLLPASSRYRERDLKSSLTSRYAKEPEPPTASLRFLYQRPVKTGKSAGKSETQDPDEDSFFQDTDEIVVDFEIRLARDLISGIGRSTRSETLKQISKALIAPRADQEKHLRDKLSVLGVDWSPPPKHEASQSLPSPTLSVRYAIDKNVKTVSAGSTVAIVGSVSNTGQSDAYQVEARIRSDNLGFEDREMIFGKIAAGATKTWTTYFKIRKSSVDRVSYLRFETTDATRSAFPSTPIRLRIVAAQPPVFAYSHQLIDMGNGDGLVQAGEKHHIRIKVQNTGTGVAEDAVALIRNMSGDAVKLKRARFDLGTLSPGQSKVVDFVFQVAPGRVLLDAHTKSLGIELQVYDTALGESVREKLRYKVYDLSQGPTNSDGFVGLSSDAKIYEGASQDSEFIAQAKPGTTVAITGRLGPWLRLNLGGGRPGYVMKKSTHKANGGPKLKGLESRMQVTPPVLNLQIPNYETRNASYRLVGRVTDDSKVEDVYIFVSNRDAKIRNRKIFYRSNRGAEVSGLLDFEANIPLWPGSNQITVVARESDEVRTAQSFYLQQNAARKQKGANLRGSTGKR